ncbi:integrase [Aurantimonas sp. 22II-16-19i]|uniref:integrase n=1 Tax=Aurantimonas sp. 22II-16-19i TaxID=1317114 RepID=UPI0009F7AED7|nr:integrase [Aurantimonas sp. 22II-16-19i]ORE89889.1 integrase catalytic subunit [Aurantimonas sp. 22II-16-19i]
MALMMGSLYDALRSANVDDEKARKAAEEVADYQKQIGEIRTDLAVLKWMTGIGVAGIVALLVRSFVS